MKKTTKPNKLAPKHLAALADLQPSRPAPRVLPWRGRRKVRFEMGRGGK
jgi:hypothetical protein